MILQGKYRLRNMSESDLEEVLAWRNSEPIRANMYNDQIISWEEHRAWFSRVQSDSSVKHLIFEHQDQKWGVVNFTNIHSRHGTGHWGFYLGSRECPKGTGTRMGFLALEYAFHQLNLRKIIGEVLAFNKPSRQFHQKLGFVEEGYFREHIFQGGVYRDVVVYSLFRTEWDNKIEELRDSLFERMDK